MDYSSSGDTGSGELGVNVDAHTTGDPIRAGAAVTVGHTWVIVAALLLVLWLFGAVLFRSVRI